MVLNIYLKVKDNKLSIINTSNKKGEFVIWFWNKNINKSDLDIEEEKDIDKEEDENKKEKDNN